MRVLVVEDEPELAAFLGRTLREAAWAPDSVTTGEGALEALAVNDYDLVILDLGLPDLEGFEVCRRWRAQGGRTPILMLTAREYALLEYLMRNPNRVLDRGRILEHVWDDNFDPVANAVDVLVGRVRRKVDPDGEHPLIFTLRGMGYMLSARRPSGAA